MAVVDMHVKMSTYISGSIKWFQPLHSTVDQHNREYFCRKNSRNVRTVDSYMRIGRMLIPDVSLAQSDF